MNTCAPNIAASGIPNDEINICIWLVSYYPSIALVCEIIKISHTNIGGNVVLMQMN